MISRTTSRNNRDYHGLGGTPTYRSWYSMIERCINPENISYPCYGAKGISVCERWLDIRNFVEDMGLRPDGMTIDRIKISGNYEKSNCRWATALEQQRNRSTVKCTVEMAASIREMASRGMRQCDIESYFPLSQSVISRIISGRIWR